MTNQFKNFIAFNLRAPDLKTSLFEEVVAADDHYESQVVAMSAHAQDPSGGQWGHTGFAVAYEDSYFHMLDGAGVLMAVQFNERILPGSVRDEKVKEAVAKLAQQQGHAVNKKDYAQLREQVEFDLLPTCLIRRSVVYAMLTPEDHLLAFTSSPKKADTVLFIVRGFFENETPCAATPLRVNHPTLPYLKSVALDHPGDDNIFFPAKTLLLKGPEKQTIRVKDRDVDSHDVQTLLKGDYAVHELGMHWVTEEEIDPVMSFAMTDTLIFKRIEIANMKKENDKDADGKVAFHSFAWVVAKEYRALIKAITEELGGAPAVEPTTPEDDGEI